MHLLTWSLLLMFLKFQWSDFFLRQIKANQDKISQAAVVKTNGNLICEFKLVNLGTVMKTSYGNQHVLMAACPAVLFSCCDLACGGLEDCYQTNEKEILQY